jgi:predicted Fe-Mo cluster-binding NifX family protein
MTRANSAAIAAKAMENGMRTLRNDGWKKVKAAKTTIEEVLRVTQTEEHLAALVEDSSKQPGWVKGS